MSAMNREQRRMNERSRREMLARDRRRRGGKRGRRGAAASTGRAQAARHVGPAPPPFQGAVTLAVTVLFWSLAMALIGLTRTGWSAIVSLPVIIVLVLGTTAMARFWAKRTVLGLVGFIIYALAELTRAASLRTGFPQTAWWLDFFLPVILFYLAAMVAIDHFARGKGGRIGGSPAGGS